MSKVGEVGAYWFEFCAQRSIDCLGEGNGFWFEIVLVCGKS